MAQFIAGMGYQSHAVPASDRYGTSGLLGTFSHKIAGRRAGLGWIGKNCMLITPQYGPRIRWGTVLTDAPITSGVIMDDKCGDCAACVEICPVMAYTGRQFAETDSLSERYNSAACRNHQSSVKICSKCLVICPWGNKALSRNGGK
jgi:epoxyqueuosine reductase QueG